MPLQAGFEPQIFRSRDGRLNQWANEAVSKNTNSKQSVFCYDCFIGKSVASPSVCVIMVLLRTKIIAKGSCGNRKFPAVVRNVFKFDQHAK